MTESTIPPECRLSTYDFELPRDLIAQQPAEYRDESRLMVLHRRSGDISHHKFKELPSLLLPSDLLVLNETKVIPVLLVGRKESGGRVELLVLDPAELPARPTSETSTERVCLIRSSKPLRPGAQVHIDGGPAVESLETVSPGRSRIRFPVREADLLGFLDTYGRPPLPPYIRADEANIERDRDRYQTVYARIAGSVAAPTAGLHFTDDLLGALERQGTETARILLHVGPATFTPVRAEDIRFHRMESEFYEISEETGRQIREAHRARRRIIAVGTTCVRALEAAATSTGTVRSGAGKTNLFLRPGHDTASTATAMRV
ncbi:MAG: S-adenosylmethionine:tRNA ribosyltransferase-isomerase [Deltaproteobacteria bacterium]